MRATANPVESELFRASKDAQSGNEDRDCRIPICSQLLQTVLKHANFGTNFKLWNLVATKLIYTHNQRATWLTRYGTAVSGCNYGKAGAPKAHSSEHKCCRTRIV